MRKKVLTSIDVAIQQPRGIGQCRMASTADAWPLHHAFVTDHMEQAPSSSPTAGRATPEWNGSATCTIGEVSGQPAPAVRIPTNCCRVCGGVPLAKQRLRGTHQGSADDAHPRAT